MDHLFLSDVHLGAFNDQTDREVRHDLAELIRYCSDKGIKMHIHGDLFDYWMEYPNWRPDFGKEILACFKDYMKKNSAVNYVTGNHDNWTKGYFEEIGFNVSNDFFDLSIDGKRFFIHHGDGLSDPDLELPRPPMHRLLRNKIFVKLYQRLLPPKAGIHTMKAFSNYSKRRAYCDPTVLNKWSEDFLKSSDYDYVISGHDHQPRVRTFNYGTYMNTGTFFEHRTVGLYTDNELQLVVWDAEEKTFEPCNGRLEPIIS
ncbi:hypothetical protein DYD21_09720 [Rhodohalobacter sp. SW132]|uniref:UDP-2,3-diacylglucosamine diphosphatase n=1 Tax=Rhodohalobacter sp. SW132 TaxID=2293433 RepID=UPI000E26AFBF|nr:metallophosphoesterase [Rhodohalobacter sp. SW132]REL33677.1 hypothetical protein DYD21_09720 [Rhodohalobacter sp. SW132]